MGTSGGRGDMERQRGGNRQRGATVVEFAFVFPFLFLLIYGVVVYAYIFVMQQSMNFAAQEAAEATVAVDPDLPGVDGLRTTVARARATTLLAWLPEQPVDIRGRVLGSSGEKVQVATCLMGTPNCPSDTDGVMVTVVFPVTDPTPVFPVLNLLFFTGQVPPLPDELVARATARVPRPST